METSRADTVITDVNKTKADILQYIGQTRSTAEGNLQKMQGTELTVQAMYHSMTAFAGRREESFTATRTGTETKMQALCAELDVWEALFRKEMSEAMRTGRFTPPVETTGAKIDKKEVSVWKLPDKSSRPDVRHWIDAVDIQLEAVHGSAYPGTVLDKFRRLVTEMKDEHLGKIIDKMGEGNKTKPIAPYGSLRN